MRSAGYRNAAALICRQVPLDRIPHYKTLPGQSELFIERRRAGAANKLRRLPSLGKGSPKFPESRALQAVRRSSSESRWFARKLVVFCSLPKQEEKLKGRSFWWTTLAGEFRW